MVQKVRHEGLKDDIGDGEYCGLLKKLGDVNRTFKERWFVLQKDKLWYFKTQQSPKAITYIALKDAVIREASTDKNRRTSVVNAFRPSERSLSFQIVTQDRVYELVAPSREQRHAWLTLLQQQTQLQVDNGEIDQIDVMIEEHELRAAEELEAKWIASWVEK